MDSQPYAYALIEAVLTGSTSDPLTQYFKSKQLHHFLTSSPNSVLRSVKILVIKMKNQFRITDQNFCAFDTYLNKIMAKDLKVTLELKNSIGRDTIEKLKIFSLVKFEKIYQKRINFSFSKIKRHVYSQKVIKIQKNIFRFIKVLNKIKDKLRIKNKLKVFSKLKINENKRFDYKDKTVIFNILERIIENCACFNEQIGIWKWKNQVYWSKRCIEIPGFFRKIKHFGWIGKEFLNDNRFINLLKNCFERTKLRSFCVIKKDFGIWKNYLKLGSGIKENPNISFEIKGLNESFQRAIRICSLYYFCRLKWIFSSFYMNTLKEARIVELRITRKIKRRRKIPIFFNLNTEYHNPSQNNLVSILKPILKRAHLHYFIIKKQKFSELRKLGANKESNTNINFDKDIQDSDDSIGQFEKYSQPNEGKIKHEKKHKNLRSTQKPQENFKDNLRILVLFMKKVKMIKEKTKTQAIFKWTKEVENKKPQNLIKLATVFLKISEITFEECNWSFKKIKNYYKESMAKTLSLLANKGIFFKHFKALILRNWLHSSKIKLFNHKFAIRRLVKLEKKLLIPFFNSWKKCKSSLIINTSIEGTLKLNQKFLKNILRIFNRKSNNQEKSALAQWKFQTELVKTRKLRKYFKISQLVSRLFLNIQKQKSYSFTILIKNSISHKLKFLINKTEKILKRFLRCFFYDLLINSKLKGKDQFSKNKTPESYSESQTNLLLRFINIVKNSIYPIFYCLNQNTYKSKLFQKLKSGFKILKTLKKREKHLITHGLTTLKSFSHSKFLLKKYATIIITTTSISYMTAFSRWVNTIREKYQDLHPKFHPLLSRLTRIFKTRQTQTKFDSFYKIFIYEPPLPDTESSPRFDQKKFFLYDFTDNDTTCDKSQSINLIFSPKAEKLNLKFLGAGKVIIIRLIKALNRKLIFAFCGIQYSSNTKNIYKFREILKKKSEILNDLRKLVWENLDQKLRKKQIGRSIKLCKKDLNSTIYQLKSSNLKLMAQRIMKPIIKSYTYSFIKLKLNN